MSERREILFRGQTRRKGEKVRISGEPVDSNWVYGGIFPGEGDFSIIYQTKPKVEKFTVYSDTVGAYTGLTDKNGTRIFEGDIIKQVIPHNLVQPFIFTVNWCEECAMFVLPCITNDAFESDFTVMRSDEIEVIGNIHDNPELLKGE